MTDNQAKAMILAAGKGMRMGSLSARTPKPLVEVGGRSILRCALDRLHGHGINQCVINVHHLADKMRAALTDDVARGFAVISDESDALLETGGGVKKALSMLAKDDFFVVNCDVIWHEKNESVLSRLRRFWDPLHMDVLLLMVPLEIAHGYDGAGDFFMDLSQASEGGPLTFRGNADAAPYAFAAVQIVKAAMYEDTPTGAWSNREIFRRAAAKGRLFGLLHTDGWFHIGTQNAIVDAEALMQDQGWFL